MNDIGREKENQNMNRIFGAFIELGNEKIDTGVMFRLSRMKRRLEAVRTTFIWKEVAGTIKGQQTELWQRIASQIKTVVAQLRNFIRFCSNCGYLCDNHEEEPCLQR